MDLMFFDMYFMHYTLIMLATMGSGSYDLTSWSFFVLEMDFVASYLPLLENKLSSTYGYPSLSLYLYVCFCP
jgi:hypothetical protein